MFRYKELSKSLSSSKPKLLNFLHNYITSFNKNSDSGRKYDLSLTIFWYE